jgi:Ca2+-binding RTX toxin-like protein
MTYVGDSTDNSSTTGADAEKYGLGGHDELAGLAPSYNFLDGGTGNDFLYLPSANTTGYLFGYGADGNDFISGFKGNDHLYGGDGGDILLGGKAIGGTINQGIVLVQDSAYTSGADFLEGGEGSDAIYGFDGDDILYGGEGDDRGSVTTVVHTYGVDVIAGLYGGDGDDYLDGGRGDDDLVGDNGDDTLVGGDGNDQLFGGYGNDTVDGGPGDDTYYWIGDGETVIDAGGTDSMVALASGNFSSLTMIENFRIGDGGSYTITANARSNHIAGNGGDDKLFGLAGNDTMLGGSGRDVIRGGGGRDLLRGGDENDIFAYTGASQSHGATRDYIYDFDDLGNDRIDFRALVPGLLAYRGGGAFTGINQVRINDVPGTSILVEVNLVGNAVPELSIRLTQTTAASMAASDFFL